MTCANILWLFIYPILRGRSRWNEMAGNNCGIVEIEGGVILCRRDNEGSALVTGCAALSYA